MFLALDIICLLGFEGHGSGPHAGKLGLPTRFGVLALGFRVLCRKVQMLAAFGSSKP